MHSKEKGVGTILVSSAIKYIDSNSKHENKIILARTQNPAVMTIMKKALAF